MLVNGIYTKSMGDLSELYDLANCGCESSPVSTQGGLFDGVPMWVWIGALAVGAMMVLKKR